MIELLVFIRPAIKRSPIGFYLVMVYRDLDHFR